MFSKANKAQPVTPSPETARSSGTGLALATLAGLTLFNSACSTTTTVAYQSGTGDPRNPTSASEKVWAKAEAHGAGAWGTSHNFHAHNVGYDQFKQHILWSAERSKLSDHCTNQILASVCPAGIKDKWVFTDIDSHVKALSEILVDLTKSARNVAETAALLRFAAEFDGMGDTNVSTNVQQSLRNDVRATGGHGGTGVGGTIINNPGTPPTTSCKAQTSCKATGTCSGPNGCGQ